MNFPRVIRFAVRQRGAATVPIVVAIVVLILLLGAWWFLRVPDIEPAPEMAPAPPPVAQPEPEPVIPPPPPPEPEPGEETAVPEPLPSLDDSDPVITAEAAEIDGADAALELAVADNVIRKWVRAALAMDEGTVVHEYRPLQSPQGALIVEALNEPLNADIGQRYRLSPKNYQRYDGYVNAFEGIDKAQLANLYKRFYPLLEQAYQQHGVDKGNLHTVVMRVIDNLLAAPIVEEEIILVQPKVHYKYFDPQLESLSEPQKLLIRMGPENTRKIQAGLRDLKKELQ